MSKSVTHDPVPEPQLTTPLNHHSLITTDADALKFQAAASLQLLFGHDRGTTVKPSALLVSSPYNAPSHLLDLKTLDKPSQLLAKALTIFKPTCPDYATAAYTESFNWDTVFELLKQLCEAEGYIWTKREFFAVEFRSCLAPSADAGRLHELDARSHQEATASGGLLKYWFGSKNEKSENLATCELLLFILWLPLWRDRYTDAAVVHRYLAQ